MRLRDYESKDFERLWRLDQRCFPPEIAYSRPELRQFMALKGAFTLVAEKGETIAGFILIHQHGRRGHVITIDVAEEFRRARVGSLLMSAGEKRLVLANADSVYLEVAIDNAPAILFYERHGYQMVGRLPGYYHGKLDAYRLGKALNAGVT